MNTKFKKVLQNHLVGLNPNLANKRILHHISHCRWLLAFIMNSLAEITCFRQKKVVFAKTSCFRCLVIPIQFMARRTQVFKSVFVVGFEVIGQVCNTAANEVGTSYTLA